MLLLYSSVSQTQTQKMRQPGINVLILSQTICFSNQTVIVSRVCQVVCVYFIVLAGLIWECFKSSSQHKQATSHTII